MVLSISVLDVNDNAPVFLQPEYATTLNETAPVGSFVVQVALSIDNVFQIETSL